MANSLLISVADCDVRVALVEDGRLAEFHLESRARNGPTGNIYKGRVVKLLPGMAAAFVNIGLERPAYLFAEDVTAPKDEFYSLWLKDEPAEAAPSRRLPPGPIGDLLHEGQEIVVQVLRGPLGTKGARLTTYITLAGHYLVFSPTLPQLGISRRITDEAERQRLRTLLEELKPPAGGFIARTASRGQSKEKLLRERDILQARWQRLIHKNGSVSAPALLYQDLETSLRVVRELFSPEIDRILVDDPAAFEKIQDYLESLNPYEKYKVELHSTPEPLFSHLGLEIDWRRLLSPKVWLKSGGYLLFGTTEALTAIDVNTGRFVGRHDLEETLLKTNLEAAREIARQLRLRNIGGLVVIDFIDMDQASHRDLVYQALLEAVGRDRAKTTVLPISSLGLVEMTRQRLRDTLRHAVTEPCHCCGGAGELLSPQTLACDLMRRLTAEAREFHGCRLTLTVHPQVAAVLRQEGQALLARLAAEHQVRVEIAEESHFSRDYYELTHELPVQ
jgi:ribonuclease G